MMDVMQNNDILSFRRKPESMLSAARWTPACAGVTMGLFCFISSGHALETGHDAAEAHSSGGLPQFDPTSFSSQVFWLLIAFAFLYVFFSRKTLPAISSVIENRREQVKGDRDTAERLKNEAEAVLLAYENGLETARAESARLSAEAVEASKKAAETAMEALRQKAETQMAALETRLNEGKSQVMDEMNTIAAEIAAEAAEKIVGISTDINQARTVVQSLNFKMSKAA
jgi:F-type H+-transporting ATPase subunit b